MHPDNKEYFDYIDFLHKVVDNPKLWESAPERYLRKGMTYHNAFDGAGELTYCIGTAHKCMHIMAERELLK